MLMIRRLFYVFPVHSVIQRALFVIIPPEKGRKGRTNKNYTTLHLDTKTYFQQTTLVKNHQPKNFRDLKIFS